MTSTTANVLGVPDQSIVLKRKTLNKVDKIMMQLRSESTLVVANIMVIGEINKEGVINLIHSGSFTMDMNTAISKIPTLRKAGIKLRRNTAPVVKLKTSTYIGNKSRVFQCIHVK